MRPLTLAALCLALTGCLPVEGARPPRPIPEPQPVADLAQCGGNGLYRLIGQSVTTLPKHGNWTALRVIKPGMMITMDYSATRLDVRVDPAGRILALNCG